MIKKISSIQNLAVFQNFNWDSTVKDKDGKTLEFSKINIIYGRNYSGKTTLSRIFRAFETGSISDKYENPTFSLQLSDKSLLTKQELTGHSHCIRVFNEDFVRDNLAFIIDPDKKITPFAVLGEDNTKIEAEIRTIQTELGENKEGEETGLYATRKAKKSLADAEQTSLSNAERGFNGKLTQKATGRDGSIKYMSDKFGDQNYTITKLKSDIETVLNPAYSPINQNKKLELEATIKEDAKVTIHPLTPVRMQFAQYCTTAQELLSRTIGKDNKIDELLLNSALENWVQAGVGLHDGKRDKCAFCNQTITKERWGEIHAHFDEESKKLTSELDLLISNLDSEKQRVPGAFQINKNLFYSKFHGQIDTLIQQYADASREHTSSLEKIIVQLKSRKDTITQAILFASPEDNTAKIIDVFESYEKLRAESNKYSASLGQSQVDARKSLRLQEVYDFCKTIGYSAELAKIAELKNKSDDANLVLSDIDSTIKEKASAIEGKKSN